MDNKKKIHKTLH